MNFLSNADADQAIMRSIENKNHIRITRRNDTDWQVYKSYVKSGSFEQGITVGKQHLDYGQEGIPYGEVGISLRLGHHKLLFSTSIQQNSLAWPTKIAKLSRRAFERQHPKDAITVRFWTAKNRDRQFYSQLKNVSIGGMQISAAAAKKYEIGPYLCAIDHPKYPVYANVILRSVDPSENSKRTILGFQFVGLEFDPQTITRLAGLTSTMFRKKTTQKPRVHWSLPWQSD